MSFSKLHIKTVSVAMFVVTGISAIGLATCAATGSRTDNITAKNKEANDDVGLYSAVPMSQVKLTKTVETLDGPRAIYDPVRDSQVREAFNKFYEDSNERSYFMQAASGYFGEPYVFPQEPQLPKKLKTSFKILSNARKRQLQELANTNVCESIQEASCSAGWKVMSCSQSNDCKPKLSAVVNIDRRVCKINDESVYSISHWPIGQRLQYKRNGHALSEAEQLENFFTIGCQN